MQAQEMAEEGGARGRCGRVWKGKQQWSFIENERESGGIGQRGFDFAHDAGDKRREDGRMREPEDQMDERAIARQKFQRVGWW